MILLMRYIIAMKGTGRGYDVNGKSGRKR